MALEPKLPSIYNVSACLFRHWRISKKGAKECTALFEPEIMECAEDGDCTVFELAEEIADALQLRRRDAK